MASVGKKTSSSKAEMSKLIEDLQSLSNKNPGTVITRNFYRANGTFSESFWQQHFAKFTDFLSAAGLLSVSALEASETNEVVGDSWNITLPKTRIRTLEELLAHCQVDLSVWEVERFLVNKWEMGYTVGFQEKKRGAVEPLFQVKATLKKRPQIIAIKSEIESLKEAAKSFARLPKAVVRKSAKTGNILEINVPDLHAGKLAWSKETGFKNYDTKIALETFRNALETLLSRVAHFEFESVLFVTGNDLLNSDDLAGRTTAGTYVDTDGRYHKTFVSVRDALISAVERLRLVAPVKIVSCPGNHDNLSAWHVADSLECYFHRYEDVTVDNSPKARKYHQFGNVLLMFTHGNTGKRQDYPLLMASEEPQMWGSSKFREAHTGHVHQTRTEEQHGVRVRILPALYPPDAWHAANGYTGNLRVAEAYVWNKDEGLVTQAFYTEAD